MTEAEWLNDGGFYRKIEFVLGHGSKRKLRLLACGVTRCFWSLLLPAGRLAVVETERWVECEASRKEWRVAHQSARQAFRADLAIHRDRHLTEVAHQSAHQAVLAHPDSGACFEALRLAMWCSHPQLNSAVSQTCFPSTPLGNNRVFDRQLPILRDIFGNPFRPVAFADSWRSETAVALASGIYAERAFDRMAILADALEEAGCDNANILSHCRGDGPHVRGCWVVDLLLGKE